MTRETRKQQMGNNMSGKTLDPSIVDPWLEAVSKSPDVKDCCKIRDNLNVVEVDVKRKTAMAECSACKCKHRFVYAEPGRLGVKFARLGG